MLNGWEHFWEEYNKWVASNIIKMSTPEVMVRKFMEESQEFLEEPSLDEVIDCMVVLMFWAKQSGISADQVLTRMYERLEIWKQRTYEVLPDGTYHHVKGDPSHA